MVMHPHDKAALKTLKAIPGFSMIVKKFLSVGYEKMQYGMNMASNIRLSPQQLPEIYNHLPPICEKLGIDEPEFYLQMDPSPNAFTFGDTKVFITVTSGLIEYMEKDEIDAILAHECGHILCHHVLYHTMAQMITALSEGVLGVMIKPIEYSLLYWDRMREFELYGTVKAIVSVCDSINYITDSDDLTDVFRLCNNYLDPKGLLIFDFNTVYKYSQIIGDSTIAEAGDEASFIWDNYYDEDTAINQYDITFFVKEKGDLYRKFEETHIQRGYTLEEMKKFVEAAGLVFIDAYDAYTGKHPTEESERIVLIACENGK